MYLLKKETESACKEVVRVSTLYSLRLTYTESELIPLFSQFILPL